MNTRLEKGQQAEREARRVLERSGLSTVQCNYRCRLGEIDLIMVDQNTLVFVEVRWRESRAFGGAAASVTARKQQRIIRAAQHFLTAHPRYSRHNCRFDVLAFDSNAAGSAPANWIKNAFYAE